MPRRYASATGAASPDRGEAERLRLTPSGRTNSVERPPGRKDPHAPDRASAGRVGCPPLRRRGGGAAAPVAARRPGATSVERPARRRPCRGRDPWSRGPRRPRAVRRGARRAVRPRRRAPRPRPARRREPRDLLCGVRAHGRRRPGRGHDLRDLRRPGRLGHPARRTGVRGLRVRAAAGAARRRADRLSRHRAVAGDRLRGPAAGARGLVRRVPRLRRAARCDVGPVRQRRRRAGPRGRPRRPRRRAVRLLWLLLRRRRRPGLRRALSGAPGPGRPRLPAPARRLRHVGLPGGEASPGRRPPRVPPLGELPPRRPAAQGGAPPAPAASAAGAGERHGGRLARRPARGPGRRGDADHDPAPGLGRLHRPERDRRRRAGAAHRRRRAAAAARGRAARPVPGGSAGALLRGAERRPVVLRPALPLGSGGTPRRARAPVRGRRRRPRPAALRPVLRRRLGVARPARAGSCPTRASAGPRPPMCARRPSRTA